MTQRKFRLIIYAVLSLGLMCVIFCLSSQPAPQSQSLSDGLLYDILVFFGFEDEIRIELYGKLIRKIAHFAEFAALGMSTTLFFAELWPDKHAGRHRRLLYPFGICALYAFSDELHQYFVPGRSMQLSDVLLDCAGALAAILFLQVLQACKYNHREERKNFE